MKNSINLLVILGTLALVGCSPKVTTTLIKAKAPLEPGEEIAVLQPEDTISRKAFVLETIRLRGRDYDSLMTIGKEKARQAGGNMLKIVNYMGPDIGTPRHRIAAVVLSDDDDAGILADSTTLSKEAVDELVMNSTSLAYESGSVRIALQGGAGIRLGKMASYDEAVMQQHAKNMRFGYNFGLDVTSFFSGDLGVGAKFQNFQVGDSMPVTAIDNSGKTVNGVLSDQISIYFIGPFARYRLLSRDRNSAFLVTFGLGYLGYYDTGIAVNESGKIRGGSIGSLYELGYDFGIGRNFSIGASLTYVVGAMRNYEVILNDGSSQSHNVDSKNAENLSNLCLSIGLRYNL